MPLFWEKNAFSTDVSNVANRQQKIETDKVTFTKKTDFLNEKQRLA